MTSTFTICSCSLNPVWMFQIVVVCWHFIISIWHKHKLYTVRWISNAFYTQITRKMSLVCLTRGESKIFVYCKFKKEQAGKEQASISPLTDVQKQAPQTRAKKLLEETLWSAAATLFYNHVTIIQQQRFTHNLWLNKSRSCRISDPRGAKPRFTLTLRAIKPSHVLSTHMPDVCLLKGSFRIKSAIERVQIKKPHCAGKLWGNEIWQDRL